MPIEITKSLPTEAISIPLITPDGKKQVYPPTSDECVYCEGNVKLRDKLNQMDAFETNLMVESLKNNLTIVGIDNLEDTTSFDISDFETNTSLNNYYDVANTAISFRVGSQSYPTNVRFVTNYFTVGSGTDKLFVDADVLLQAPSTLKIYLLTDSDQINWDSGTLLQKNNTNIINLVDKTQFRLMFQFTGYGDQITFKSFGWGLGKLENDVNINNPPSGPGGEEVVRLLSYKQDKEDVGLMTNNKTVVGAINEVFQDVDNGKTMIASAITDKGVSTSGTESFSTMASNIRNIPVGIDTSDATATNAQLLSGYDAYAKGAKITGSMPNQGTKTSTLTTQGGSYTIPAGYHNGSGVITANISNLSAGNIASGVSVGGVSGTYTNDATATASQILTGNTAYVKGAKITGSMVNQGTKSSTITTQGGSYTIPAGYHSGSGVITASFANLSAANIRQGVNIGGVTGTYSGNGFTGTLTLKPYGGGNWHLSSTQPNNHIAILTDAGEILYFYTTTNGTSTGTGANIYISNGVVKSSGFQTLNTDLTCTFTNATRIYMKYLMRESSYEWWYPNTLSGLSLATGFRSIHNAAYINPATVKDDIVLCYNITSSNPTITFARASS